MVCRWYDERFSSSTRAQVRFNKATMPVLAIKIKIKHPKPSCTTTQQASPFVRSDPAVRFRLRPALAQQQEAETHMLVNRASVTLASPVRSLTNSTHSCLSNRMDSFKVLMLRGMTGFGYLDVLLILYNSFDRDSHGRYPSLSPQPNSLVSQNHHSWLDCPNPFSHEQNPMSRN